MNKPVSKNSHRHLEVALEPLREHMEREGERFRVDPVFRLEVEARQAMAEGDPRRAQDLKDRAAELDRQE